MDERDNQMIQTYQRIQRQRAAGEIEGGFTLIELLIVIVVLGILAAIVVFALGGVTKSSAVAACQSDAKTVGIAVSAMEAENPGTALPITNALWQAALNPGTGLTGAPFLQSWPTGTTPYTIAIAGTTSALTAMAGAIGGYPVTAVTPAVGDVEVIIGTGAPTAGQGTYDATQYPISACASA